MKFGKEFSSQMVQEWQEAYMDYNSLKQLLKDLLKYRLAHVMPAMSASPLARSRSLKRRHTLYRAFSGLTGRHRGTGTPRKNDEEVILVSEVDGTESHYQTTFLGSAEEGGERELFFFSRLDNEFNKVVRFYREKVGEAKSEAEELSKQMDALIALRTRVDKVDFGHQLGQDQVTTSESNSRSPPPASIAASVDRENPGTDQNRMEAIEEIEMSNEAKGFKAAPLGVLDYVKINIHPETPLSTLRNVMGNSKLEVTFSKEELREAKEKLRQALIGFYHQLRLLKNYCFLNMLAFSKIMKKYDKITSRCASKAYLEMVDKSYLGSSDEVNRLIERIEATFIKHFTNGNRRKGMRSLRPGHKRERHRTTFFLGLFSGCSVALLVSMIVIIHARNILNHEGRDQYMENLFPLYRYLSSSCNSYSFVGVDSGLDTKVHCIADLYPSRWVKTLHL